MRITIPKPQDQPPFRPIHFAARQRNGEVHIFVWKSLDDAVRTIKTLVPNLRPFLTAEHVRGLAAPDRSADELSHDEFAALWFAKTVYDPGLYLPTKLDGFYDADGAAKRSRDLMAEVPAARSDPLSAWSKFVRTLVLDVPAIPEPPSSLRSKVVESHTPTPDVKLCKHCGILPMVDSFKHDPPNWLIHCPGCGAATDPREGIDMETALEAWNKGN